MSKLKIAIDVDSVLNNLMEKTIETYNKKYDCTLSMEDFTDYDVYNCLPYEQAKKFIDLFIDENVVKALSPRDGAQKAIKQLINKGHEVYFATSTHHSTFQLKVEWIKNYFDGFPEKNVICINNKGLLHVDVLVDDCIDNLLSSFYFERVCMDFPWNRHVHDEAYGIYRCYNWNDVIKAIDDINNHIKN